MGSRWWLVASATIAVGCTMSRAPPRAQAAAIEASCGQTPSAADARIIESRNVDRVEPLYAIVYSTPNGMESRLIGARVHLRTIDGVTAEAVGHTLTCHAARETLSTREASDTCPYFVPGVWVDINVKADPMGYEVALRGQDFEEARQILDRARIFARN
jgi:hypothetical protein